MMLVMDWFHCSMLYYFSTWICVHCHFQIFFSLSAWQVTDTLETIFASRGWNLQNIIIPTDISTFPYEEAFTWVSENVFAMMGLVFV